MLRGDKFISLIVKVQILNLSKSVHFLILIGVAAIPDGKQNSCSIETVSYKYWAESTWSFKYYRSNIFLVFQHFLCCFWQ